MIIGCFALVEPFRPMKRQFQAIAEMGIRYADLTDNHQGGMLGVEYGFSASVSLDSHPERIRELLEDTGITLTSVCAHANLLDPASPEVYGTAEIIKAVRLAYHLGIKQVITTEGDPKTPFSNNFSMNEKILLIHEKLYSPICWAEELGVELLLEPHGEITDSVEGTERLLEAVGHEETIGICLDTGNSWLGGSEPLEFVARFGRRIKHVHWKDMGKEWEEKRGTIFGCGMATIPLGDGVVGVEEIVRALVKIGFDGPTTLEVAGSENVKLSAERLEAWEREARGQCTA